MFQEEYFLPFSNQKYQINQFGHVLDSSGNKVETYILDKRIYVDIDWVNGTKRYPVALLVLSAFLKLYGLPFKFYDKVIPLFRDGLESNLTPANLIYHFDGLIEAENYPGFFYIPLTPSHVINIDGLVINAITGKTRRWSKTQGGGPSNRKGGYQFMGCSIGNGLTKSIFLHRALAMVFKTYGNNVLNITINHKDGNPLNNKLDNLEWATYAENNIHAIENNLRNSRSTPVFVKNLKTGEIKRYPTITACSKAMGYSQTATIRYRLENAERCLKRVYSDFLQYKYDDGSEWPEVDTSVVSIAGTGEGRDIIARNVFTGDLVVFKSASEGIKLFNVEPSVISRHLRDNALIPSNGWNFQFLDTLGPWPNHTHRHLEIYKKNPKHPRNGVIVINNQTKEEIFYTSVRECAELTGFQMATLLTAISTKRIYKGCFFEAFKLEKNLGPPIE